MSETKLTQVIDLPSRGWFYPEGHPLASGKLEVYFMTARHEDILTSRNLVQRGIVIDKLMEALIADPKVKYDDILTGDKNGLMIAARILGYGKNYEFNLECPSCARKSTQHMNLEDIEDKKLEFRDDQRGKNQFEFVLPLSGKTILFKLFTHKDEKTVNAELETMRKLTKSEVTSEVTTRMRRAILAVDGDDSPETIRKFVDSMPARDASAFREHSKAISPNVDLTFDFECFNCGYQERSEVPITANFFWPDARV
jgi:hypothetical protein